MRFQPEVEYLKIHINATTSKQGIVSRKQSALRTKKRVSQFPPFLIFIRNFIIRIWRIILHEFTENTFFSISLCAAVITSCFNMPQWSYINVKVLVCLFELMLIVKAYEEYGLLGHIAVKMVNYCRDERRLTMALCLISFLLSMFTTNDVAVLTVVPILITIARKCELSAAVPCVLVTVAANLGSSTTPIGNPQNLYLFSFFKMSLSSFFRNSLPLCAASLLLLMASSLFIRPKKIQVELKNIPVINKKRATTFLLLAVPVIAGVIGLIPYTLTLMLVLLIAIVLNRNLIRKVDYRLLLTFLFLFIAIGNISHIPVLRAQIATLATTPIKTYTSALLLSQIISNVPCTIMLAPFSNHVRELFYGVNIGGLGTPVASLASIISYSLFGQAFSRKKLQFMKIFLFCNFSLLIILGTAFAFAIMKM